MPGPETEFPHPVFVGGVGRSGTHPMGRLIAADPRYVWIRTEVRFHASPGGLPYLCEGRVAMKEFLATMRGRWWRRGHGQKQGLQRIVEPELFDTALAEFEREFERDRYDASRRLITTLLDPFAERAGKPAWVEITGEVIAEAPFLLRLFPSAKFINMVRDGRAVVAGTLRKVDLTDDPIRALDKWEEMIEASERGIRSVPETRVLTVFLDDLTSLDREATFDRLVEFLETPDPEPMSRYFDEEITAERASVGRWRERMAPADARKVDWRYRRVLRKLRRRGVDWIPEPERWGLPRPRSVGRR